jgi:hypothetical protein
VTENDLDLLLEKGNSEMSEEFIYSTKSHPLAKVLLTLTLLAEVHCSK